MKLWVFCCKTLKDKTIKKFLLPHKDYQDWFRLIERLKYFLLTQSLVFPSYQGDSTICHKGNFLKLKGVVLPHPPLRHLNGTIVSDKISTAYLLNKFGMTAVNQLNGQAKLLEMWKALNIPKYPLEIKVSFNLR